MALTAAHRSLPFGTLVRVTNLANGRRVVVVIDDRGPFLRGRVIDLSVAAARRLGMVRGGVAPVRIKVIRWAERSQRPEGGRDVLPALAGQLFGRAVASREEYGGHGSTRR